jgi:predicted transposase YbfD/YdcC
LHSVIKVTREITKRANNNCESYTEVSYYISSLNPLRVTAKIFNQGIRNHWSVEIFHYLKDTVFQEDRSKCNSGNSAQNLSVMKNIAINIFRQFDYSNLAQAIRLISNNIPQLKRMLGL